MNVDRIFEEKNCVHLQKKKRKVHEQLISLPTADRTPTSEGFSQIQHLNSNPADAFETMVISKYNLYSLEVTEQLYPQSNMNATKYSSDYRS